MTIEAFDQLSPREQKVMLSLMGGATAKQISQSDAVSLATVRSQIRSIFSKLGVRSQLAAVVLAYESGWPPSRDPSGNGQSSRRRA